MRQFLSLLLVTGLFSNLLAQNNFWTPINSESIALPEGTERRIQPLKSKTFLLDYAGLKSALSHAPMEFTSEAKQHPLLLKLPMADGSMRVFKVWESPIMAPELMADFPEIRTYAGKDVESLGMKVRLGVSQKGFHAFIFEENGQTQAINPYAVGAEGIYMAYHQKDLPASGANEGHAQCGVDADFGPTNAGVTKLQSSDDRDEAEKVTLKKYRLAVSAQGEYATYHGGTKISVMSAIVEAVNYIVAIQERDWAVRLELVHNNDTLIYFDPATDPFSGPLIPDWIGDNPGAINSRININSYDIGHLFARVLNPSGVYVAGQAALSSVCTQADKAVAGSSLPNPDGPDYYLVIAHEMGHQFSATHTFSSCPPAQDQLSSGTAFEPGGGSTIMSYSGTCAPDVVVNNSDSYFHVGSIEQVAYFTTLEVGSTCPELIITDNHFPVVTIPLTDNFYIPISTPFALKGIVTDEDSDNLTYCWEEFDLGQTQPLGQAVGTSPLFRSFPPANSPTRTFPRINTIVSNASNSAELLPNYSREIKFKLTARDNNPEGGGVTSALVRFHSAATAGPFRVTYPNTNTVIWNIGEYQTVTWDVANTDLAPVACQKVNLLLSLDGGFTYPITLAENQPNIGRACIQVPNNPALLARVRVEAADNIFFDISNANFKIQQPGAASFTLCPATLKSFVCLPNAFTTEISTAALSGFADSVTLSVSGLPNGVTATFSPNPVLAGGTSDLSISIPNNTPESTFDVTIQGLSGTITSSSVITLSSVNNDFSAFAPTAPANGASGVNPNPLLQWTTAADANAYDVELATSPSFLPNTLVASKLNTAASSFQITVQLTEGGVYYWRVRPKNECGDAAWSATQVFVVSVLNCAQLAATDLPKNISPNGTPTVESKITLLSGGQISDVNVKRVQGFHEYFKDLEVRLISPAGTDVLLWKDRCSSYNGAFDISFDDGAAATFSCPPPTNNAEFKPSGLLSSFAGQSATGVWTLRVKDNEISSGGTLSAFEIEICSNEATNPPLITVNNVLNPASGNSAVIDANFLKAVDANNTPTQLVFTLVTVPQKGLLQLFGGDLQIGGQFTQADIDNGGLKYFDYGFNNGSDQFQIVVADNEGGMDTDIFQISAIVGTKAANLGALDFALTPNPADAMLRLSLTEPLGSNAIIALYNTAGQRVRSWSLASGNTSISLQIADLPGGVYAVSIENDSARGVKKLVIR